MTMTELDPAHLDTDGLAEHIALEQEGGWGPPHFVPPDADGSQRAVTVAAPAVNPWTEAVCMTYAGAPVEDVYAMTSDRAIFDRWHAVGWGCRACAEVLHS